MVQPLDQRTGRNAIGDYKNTGKRRTWYNMVHGKARNKLISAGADTLPLKIRKNSNKTQTNLHILGWALGILKNSLFF